MNSFVTTVELGSDNKKTNLNFETRDNQKSFSVADFVSTRKNPSDNLANKRNNFKQTIIKNGLDDGKAKIITSLVYKLYENCGPFDCVLEPNYWLKNQKYEKKLWDANKEFIKKCSKEDKQFLDIFKNEESLYYNKFMYEYCPLIKNI